MKTLGIFRVAWPVLVLSLFPAMGCSPAASGVVAEHPKANKWLKRAEQSYRKLDMEDARDSVEEALRDMPQDPKTRLLAANIALASLDYDATIELTEGITSSEALAVRARAFWYRGDVKRTGQVLAQLLHDPDVHDPWAKEISKLTNRGTGREPFRVDGSIVAAIEMAPVRAGAMVVPVEIDGERGLAVIATGTADVVLDSAQRKEPSWISIRFDGRVEFHDVPAVTQDLTGLSRQLGAPIKALLGINLLRHAHPTFDVQGRQFVVRRFEPPRPPSASEIPVYYARGGGMLVNAHLGADPSSPVGNFFVDTAMMAPMSLTPVAWKKAGVALDTLTPVPGAPNQDLKQGTIPLLRLGVFDLPQVPSLLAHQLDGMSKSLGIPIDGVLGAGVMGEFRVTLVNGGRSMWLEKDFAPDAPPDPTTGAPTAQRPSPPQSEPQPTSDETPPSAKPPPSPISPRTP